MKRVSVLGSEILAATYEEAIRDLLERARGDGRERGHFCTVHSIVEGSRDERLRSVFGTGLSFTDGMPLVWIARRRGAGFAERVCGPDVLASLCDRGRPLGFRHFFLGGAPGTPEALAESLGHQFPGLNTVGMHSPPFRELTPAEDDELVRSINAAHPDILWVGLGSPKQDFWAAAHLEWLDVPLVLAVGAAFDFQSGKLRRAPGWLRRIGLEWLFRLAMEPRRLFRRYLTTNLRFIYLLTREEIGRRRRGKAA